MRPVAPDRQKLAAEEAVPVRLDSLDEGQPGLCRPTGQERRDGQEELVDEPRSGERAERVRSRLEQDQPMAALLQRAQGNSWIDLRLGRERRHLDGVRQPAPAPRFSRTVPQLRPRRTASTATVLADLGFSESEIAAVAGAVSPAA